MQEADGWNKWVIIPLHVRLEPRTRPVRNLIPAAKNLAALLLGCIVALGMLEAALRIKNPFESRVRADRIVLPVHRRYVLVGGPAAGPRDTVIHTTNSLGFRGREPPAGGISRHLSVIAVGGS